jgi:hypothetical protein
MKRELVVPDGFLVPPLKKMNICDIECAACLCWHISNSFIHTVGLYKFEERQITVAVQKFELSEFY